MTLREEAERDLAETLEDLDGAGSSYVLVDKTNTQYPVVGVIGDIGYLLNEDGAPVQGRTIEATCRMATLHAAGAPVPERGWKLICSELSGKAYTLYVQRVEPDRMLGVYRFSLSVKLIKEGNHA